MLRTPGILFTQANHEPFSALCTYTGNGVWKEEERYMYICVIVPFYNSIFDHDFYMMDGWMKALLTSMASLKDLRS